MKILKNSKKIDELNLEINFKVVLPDDYDETSKNYPVIYQNDGQDLFDKNERHWGDDCLEYGEYYKSYKKYLPECIIVALIAPEDKHVRTTLYSPFRVKTTNIDGEEEEIVGKGDVYLKWIATELKPWIDQNFRTKTDKDNTGILGYSSAGLFANYAATSEYQIFGLIAGLSSGAKIWEKELVPYLQTAKYNHISRVYLDVGTNEDGRLSKPQDFIDGFHLLKKNYIEKGVFEENIQGNIYQRGKHLQSDWKLRYPNALRWLLSNTTAD